jgi:hypothetical protein
VTLPPIVEHHKFEYSPRQSKQVRDLAQQLIGEVPDLATPEEFAPLVTRSLEEAPCLHLDDLGDIPLLSRFYDCAFLQDRARLRAGTGDWVASCATPIPAFEDYCSRYLGLGSPEWLHPRSGPSRLRVALACWKDRQVRRTLIHALRDRGSLTLHPHIGTLPVWELAALLHHTGRCPVHVIAPPPGVTRWVNDKLHFADTVRRLFGERSIPTTRRAANLATLAREVQELAGTSRWVVIKLPDSAGGGGNVRVESARFRGRTLAAIRTDLKRLLAPLRWKGASHLLVGSWEQDVLCAPSAQLWIPPRGDGKPVIEGVYEQMIEGPEGMFVGSRPARFPEALRTEIAGQCGLLALLYQRLGYVGRCSFDLLLVGEDFADCRPEWIECNGRWGGTSLPMTLMNRLFGDWSRLPYVSGECLAEGLAGLRFEDVLGHFESDLFSLPTGEGRIIFYNPGMMQAHHGIEVLALGETWEEAQQLLNVEVPERLRELTGRRAPGRRRLL